MIHSRNWVDIIYFYVLFINILIIEQYKYLGSHNLSVPVIKKSLVRYSEPCNGKIILKTKWKRCYERERRNRKTVRETERVVMLGPRFNGPYLAQL